MRGTFIFMARSQQVPHAFPISSQAVTDRQGETGLSRRARQARRASIAMAASLVSIITTPPARLHKASRSNSYLRLLHPSLFVSTPIFPTLVLSSFSPGASQIRSAANIIILGLFLLRLLLFTLLYIALVRLHSSTLHDSY